MHKLSIQITGPIDDDQLFALGTFLTGKVASLENLMYGLAYTNISSEDYFISLLNIQKDGYGSEESS